jgi:NADH:ubiquinone oxidoreductase subunit K
MIEETYIDEYAPAAATERLAPSASATRRADVVLLGKVGLMLWAIVLLILYTARMVVQVDSQAFAVLAAFGVAGVIWLAFGKRQGNEHE